MPGEEQIKKNATTTFRKIVAGQVRSGLFVQAVHVLRRKEGEFFLQSRLVLRLVELESVGSWQFSKKE
jgi:hypothetical protein